MASIDNTQLSSGMQYLDYLQMGVMVIDRHNHIVYWNRWLENHSNIMVEDVINQPFNTIFPDLVDSRLSDVINQALEERLSAVISAPLNNSLLPLYPSINHQLNQMDLMRQMVQVSAISDGDGNDFALLQINDMTHALAKGVQLRSQTKAIQSMVSKDALTEVATRAKFDESLENEFRRAQRAGTSLILGMVDVDHFKMFNNHYGESVGNDCLSEIAKVFDHVLNRSTDMIARYSGQVFGVLMPCTSYPGGLQVAEEVRNAVKTLEIAHDASTTAPFVTVSIGLAYVEPTREDQLDAVIEAAAFALGQAKEIGGDHAMVYVMKDGSLHDCNVESRMQMLIEA